MPTLARIVGQDPVVATLRRAFEQGRMAQAYLFAGPQGVGKVTSALAFAAAINCAKHPGLGCDECSTCDRIQRGVHPDVIHVRSEKQVIKIEAIRTLLEQLTFAPFEGGHRIVLIDGAEDLNAFAANSLLKAVEEPRPRTHFILVTHAPSRVVPTLISRCQRLRFTPLDPTAIRAIVARVAPDLAPVEESLVAAIHLGDGSAGRTLELLSQAQLPEAHEDMRRLLTAAAESDACSIFDAVTAIDQDREYLIQLVNLMQIQLRDLLVSNESDNSGQAIPEQRYFRQLLIRALYQVRHTLGALLGNANPALALEELLWGLRPSATVLRTSPALLRTT